MDDLTQAANEWAWKRRDRVEDFLVREDEADRKRGQWALLTALQRAAERHARQAKAEASGYNIEDEYYYSAAVVEQLIKVWVTGDYSLAGQVLDPSEMGGKRTKVASEGGNILAYMADVEKALNTLEVRTRAILTAKFGDDVSDDVTAAEWGITRQRVDQIAARGVRQVVDALGGPSPYR